MKKVTTIKSIIKKYVNEDAKSISEREPNTYKFVSDKSKDQRQCKYLTIVDKENFVITSFRNNKLVNELKINGIENLQYKLELGI